MNWLKARLKEKSTITALVGLIAAILPYTNIPPALQNPLIAVIGSLLVSFAITTG